MLRMLIVAPLLVLPILVYALVALFSGGNGAAATLESAIFGISMMSGEKWRFTIGDFILLIGLITLFIEILKAARTEGDAIANHSLSMFLLLAAVIAFLVIPGFGTSVFFLLIMMCVLDVVTGPIVSIVAARRDFGVGEGLGN